MSMRQIFGRFNRSLSKHSTEILIIGGTASLIYSGVKIVQATIKSTHEIDAKLAEKQRQLDEENKQSEEPTPEAKMEPKEIVKEVWKNYIPAIATAVFGFVCFLEADHIHRKGKSALMALYALSEADRIDFKKKAEEIVGKTKVQEIQQEVQQERVAKETNAMAKADVIETGHGTTLIKDSWTGRYFRCDYEFIRKKCNDLTYRLWSAMEMNLNSLYYEIPNMEPADCGEYVGWIAEDGPIEPFFTSTFSSWGEPCAVMQFEVPPHYLK